MSAEMAGKVRRLIPRTWSRRLPRKIVVVEVDSRESRRISRLYQKKNKPANVLSLRYGSDYGEILVCPEVIRREAEKQGNSYKYQMTWMIIHGIIHLAGIHHEKSRTTAVRSEKLEKLVLRKLFARKRVK